MLSCIFSCYDSADLICSGSQDFGHLDISKEALSFFNVKMQNTSFIVLTNENGESLKLQVDTNPLAGDKTFLRTSTTEEKTIPCSNNASFVVSYMPERFKLGLYEPEKGFFVEFNIEPVVEFTNGQFIFYDYLSLTYNGSGTTSLMVFNNKEIDNIIPAKPSITSRENFNLNGKTFKNVYMDGSSLAFATFVVNRREGLVSIRYNNQWWSYEKLE